jgi:hypothetical protein
MKIISTKIHGLLDYAVSLIIIATPWLFDFNNDGPQTWLLVIAGIITIMYSVVTSYDYSLADLIPFNVHLALDTLSGIFIASSPWLFGFHDKIFVPHLLIGMLEILVVLFSKKSTRLLNKKYHAKSWPH